MANNLNSNPLLFDTKGATSAVGKTIRIQCIQWVNDDGAIVDTSTLDIRVNGISIKAYACFAQAGTPVAETGRTVFYQAGPFTHPIVCSDFYVTDMDEGNLLVWVT